jgi:hypothetical protein
MSGRTSGRSGRPGRARTGRRGRAGRAGAGCRALVELTPVGVETLGEIRARREDWLTAALDEVLDADERERLRAAIALLGRVADT